jgi:hypothetical protein
MSKPEEVAATFAGRWCCRLRRSCRFSHSFDIDLELRLSRDYEKITQTTSYEQRMQRKKETDGFKRRAQLNSFSVEVKFKFAPVQIEPLRNHRRKLVACVGMRNVQGNISFIDKDKCNREMCGRVHQIITDLWAI